MTAIYITGTRHVSPALQNFLPDYLDWRIHQGDEIVTSNKPGVDEWVIQHCDQQKLPLRVCEFFGLHQGQIGNRAVQTTSESVQVQRIISPRWLRFRRIIEEADQVVFFHAAKTRGKPLETSTINAFEQVCERRGVKGEQMIVQCQERLWIPVQELRNAPTLGTAHVYLHARYVAGLGGERHCIGYFRIETWRRMGQIVQPGVGRKEFVLPSTSREQTLLHMLHQALLVLQVAPPPRLVIHHANAFLENMPFTTGQQPYAELRTQVRELLESYSQVSWQQGDPLKVQNRIGERIFRAQELWNHRKPMKAYQGVYG